MTINDLIKEAQRESAMRRRVYPNSAGTAESKERQLRAMDAIEAILRDLAANPEILSTLTAAGRITAPHPELF